MDAIRAFLSALFLRIYCLSPASILFLLLGFTACFVHLHRRLDGRIWWRGALAGAVILWGCAILWATVWSRSGSGTASVQLIPLHSYRAVLSGGDPELLRSNFMNVILFYPAGMMIGSLFPRGHRLLCFPVVLTGAVCFSLSIEYLQFSRALGQAEIDDVIHNTLGALLGCLAVSFRTKKL